MSIDPVIYEQQARTPRMSVNDIIAAEARKRGASFGEVLGRSRIRPITYARCASMRAIKAAYPHYSSTMIGRVLMKDHSTVLFHLGALNRKCRCKHD